MAPPPLTPAAKRLTIGALVVGILVVLFEGFRIFTVKDSDIGLLDAMIGAGGGGMAASAAINLFHRPDR